jgi:hypothetical protein
MDRRNDNFLNFPKNLKSAFLIGAHNAYLHLYRNCGNIAKKYKKHPKFNLEVPTHGLGF